MEEEVRDDVEDGGMRRGGRLVSHISLHVLRVNETLLRLSWPTVRVIVNFYRGNLMVPSSLGNEAV